jgi:hypothetical protein
LVHHFPNHPPEGWSPTSLRYFAVRGAPHRERDRIAGIVLQELG